jgi:uncharacterized protein (UPF0332 family)
VTIVELSDLEREGLIKKIPIAERKVKDSFNLAKRDIETAKSILKDNPDWAYTIAYNSILQISRALMFSMGYRPHGQTQHVSVVRFIEAVLGEEHTTLVLAIDRMRRKRHIAVYDTAGTISTKESKNAIKRAVELLSEIEAILKEKDFLSE